jgi:hypothetical protein
MVDGSYFFTNCHSSWCSQQALPLQMGGSDPQLSN